MTTSKRYVKFLSLIFILKCLSKFNLIQRLFLTLIFAWSPVPNLSPPKVNLHWEGKEGNWVYIYLGEKFEKKRKKFCIRVVIWGKWTAFFFAKRFSAMNVRYVCPFSCVHHNILMILAWHLGIISFPAVRKLYWVREGDGLLYWRLSRDNRLYTNVTQYQQFFAFFKLTKHSST